MWLTAQIVGLVQQPATCWWRSLSQLVSPSAPWLVGGVSSSSNLIEVHGGMLPECFGAERS